MSVQKSISESGQIAEQTAPGVSGPRLRLPVRYVEGIYNRDNNGSAPGSIICADGWFLATVEDAPNAVAKAAFIVRACNSHEALVKALAWALPLAELALNSHRLERIRCGHQDIRGKNKTGEIIGLHQFEIDDAEFARAALASAREVRS